jgi:hypothetical protein
MELYIIKNIKLMKEKIVPAFRPVIEKLELSIGDSAFQPTELSDVELYEALSANNGQALVGFEWDEESQLPALYIGEDEQNCPEAHEAMNQLITALQTAVFNKALAQLIKDGLIEPSVGPDGKIYISATTKGRNR